MRGFRSLVPRRARLCSWGVVVAVVLAAGTMAVAPSVATAQCPEANPTYMDGCGPTFVVPHWGDAGGWTDPSKYSTIQLADFNGDGKDELLARNDQGIEIFWFDTDLGQWSPQVDATGVQQVLTDFRSPLPNEAPATNWTKPEYYSTIQTAHINGNPNAQVLARFADGMRVYYFSPGPGGSINGGSWSLISQDGPFSDAGGWNEPSRYSTIRTAELVSGATDLVGRSRTGLVTYNWNGSGWSPRPVGSGAAAGRFADANCGVPACYDLFRTADTGGGLAQAIFGRTAGGPAVMEQYATSGGGGWSEPLIAGFQPFSDQPGAADCPFPGTSDCLGSSPAYYETFGAADLDGDGADEVFARAADGLRVKSPSLPGVTTYDDQGGLLDFGGGWTRATNVPGAIDGTLTSSVQGAGPVYADGFDEDVALIRVIGPVGPGLGQLVLVATNQPEPVIVDQSAPRRREQQVLYEGPVEDVQDFRLGIEAFEGTAVIDAIRTYDSADRSWSSLATLGGLAGTAQAWNSTPGRWASIRTGDIDGNGADEVLALDGNALQAWSYGAGANAWRQLPASPPLTLTGDWLAKPEYYATIRVGDVDGDGRDDVVARGPFGIRTWFYNRRGTGGWERYLAGGYADFPGGNGGQAAAFTALNGRYGSDIRGAWTAEAPPDETTLQTLQTNLAGHVLGDCDPNSQTQLAPPVYGSCTPPAGNNPFSAAEWTAVVNALLAEAYLAEQVLDHYTDLDTMREGVFESQTGTLPAIAGDLKLAGAAGNTADYNMDGAYGAAAGIGAAIAGLFPELAGASAALWVAAEAFSALPSASQVASSNFEGTYDDLLHKVAAAQADMDKALGSQRQQVLGDQGLLRLVGGLRSRGTWKPDTAGMLSASRQAFALTTYQALLPTMFPRYSVTNCTTQSYATGTLDCDLPTGPYAITSGRNDRGAPLNGTWVGPQLSQDPCVPTGYYDTLCDYASHPGTIADSVGSIVWDPVPESCNYQPGNLGTVWIFGSNCSLGVPTATSIGADSPGWTFTTRTGNPVIWAAGAVRAVPGAVRASAASPRAARPGASARATRDRLSPLRFRGRVSLTRALRLRRMRVVMDRTLFEHGRREELARSGSRRRLRPFTLRHVRDGLFTSRRRGGPRVRLRVRRLDRRRFARLDLRLARVRTRDIRALCAVLPARVSSSGRRLELETRLRLRDGAARNTITMRQRWRCARDRKGEFTGIRPVKPKAPTTRPGLAVRLGTPRVTASGRRATVVATVSNKRRRRPSRVVSSLWDVRIAGSAAGPLRTAGFKELRARRSRTVRLTVRVPRRARGRVCVRVAASAASARGATARRCTRVAGAPPSAGCATDGHAACAPAARRQRAAGPATPSPTSSTIVGRTAHGTGAP